MVLNRWRKIFRPKLSPQELLRKVVEEEHMTVRDLEGHHARGHKEFRNGDIVRIKQHIIPVWLMALVMLLQ